MSAVSALVERAVVAVIDRLIPAATIPAAASTPAAAAPSPGRPAPSRQAAPGTPLPLRPTTTSTSPWTNKPDLTPDVPFAVYIGLARP